MTAAAVLTLVAMLAAGCSALSTALPSSEIDITGTTYSYRTHVLVKGHHERPSTNNITIDHPHVNLTMVDDPDVEIFIPVADYNPSNEDYNESKPCSFDSVEEGTPSECVEAIALKNATDALTIGEDGEQDLGQSIFARIAQDVYQKHPEVQEGILRRMLKRGPNRGKPAGEFDKLNTIFKGVELHVPDQNINSKNMFLLGKLKIQLSNIVCGQLKINDISMREVDPLNAAKKRGGVGKKCIKKMKNGKRCKNMAWNGDDVRAQVSLKGVKVMCSLKYKWSLGKLFRGNGHMSAGGNKHSLTTTFDLPRGKKGRVKHARQKNCLANVNLKKFKFSGTFMNMIKGAFKGHVEKMLEKLICRKLGKIAANVLTAITGAGYDVLYKYIHEKYGGQYRPGPTTINPLVKEQSLDRRYQSSLISWKKLLLPGQGKFFGENEFTILHPEADPMDLMRLVPDGFNMVKGFLSKRRECSTGKTPDLGVNCLLRSTKIIDPNTGLFTYDWTKKPETSRGWALYHGDDPLTHTEIGLLRMRVGGIDTFSHINSVADVLGHQTFGHAFRIERVTVSMDMYARIGPSRARNSLVAPHNVVGRDWMITGFHKTLEEHPTFTVSFAGIDIEAASFLAVTKRDILSLRLGSIVRAPIDCIAGAVNELEVLRIFAKVAGIQDAHVSGDASPGIRRVLDEATQIALSVYQNAVLAALPGAGELEGLRLMNHAVTNFLRPENNARTCVGPDMTVNSGIFMEFKTDELWSKFQTFALDAINGRDRDSVKTVNKMFYQMTVDKGRPALPVGLLPTANVSFGNQTHGRMRGRLGIQNWRLSGLHSIDSLELLAANPYRYDEPAPNNIFAGTKFDESLLEDPDIASPYTMSSTVSIGRKNRPMRLSVDLNLEFGSTEQSLKAHGAREWSLHNNVTLSADFVNLEVLLMTLTQLDLGTLKNLRIRHFPHLNCWIAVLKRLGFPRVRAIAQGWVQGEVKCHKCTGSGVRELEKTFKTPSAREEITTLINNRIFPWLSEIIEGDGVHNALLKRWVESAEDRCTLATQGLKLNGELATSSELSDILSRFGKDKEMSGKKKKNLVKEILWNVGLGATILALVVSGRCIFRRERKLQKWLLKRELGMDSVQKRHLGKKTTTITSITVAHPNPEKSSLIANTESMFRSPSVPRAVRYLVPLALLVNVGFFLSGHLQRGAVVRLEANFGGDSFELPETFEFFMLKSTIKMWNSESGKMMAFVLIFFSFIWPYTKLAMSIWLWFAPPKTYAPACRGAWYELLDFVGKWSVLDVIVLVVMIVGFNIKLLSPAYSFLPPEFYHVEIKIIPLWGLYANAIAQLINQGLSHLIIYYHRVVVAHAEAETGFKLLSTKDAKREIAEEQQKETMKTTRTMVAKTKAFGVRKSLADRKEALCSHVYVKPIGTATHEAWSRVQMSLFGRSLVVFLLVATGAAVIIGSSMQGVSMQTTGVVGILMDWGRNGTSTQSWSAMEFVRESGKQASNTVGSAAGIHLLAGLFALTVFIVPCLQLLVLLVLWAVPMTLKTQRQVFLANEALSSWQYLEVYIIGIGLCIIQITDISRDMVRPICGSLDNMFRTTVDLGILTEKQATCFTMVTHMKLGMYVLICAVVFLNILNTFIVHAATAAMEDREARARGDRHCWSDEDKLDRFVGAVLWAFCAKAKAIEDTTLKTRMATIVDVENPLRGKSVDVKNMKSVQSKSKTPPSSGMVVVAKSKDWSVYLDRKTGNRFYRNEKTGLDQRNMPAIGWIQNMKAGGGRVAEENLSVVQSKSKTPPSSGMVVVAKSKDWSVYLDRKTGSRFYRNEKTGLDQRNMPAIGWIQNMKSSKSAGGKPNPNAHKNMMVRRPSPPSIR